MQTSVILRQQRTDALTRPLRPRQPSDPVIAPTPEQQPKITPSHMRLSNAYYTEQLRDLYTTAYVFGSEALQKSVLGSADAGGCRSGAGSIPRAAASLPCSAEDNLLYNIAGRGLLRMGCVPLPELCAYWSVAPRRW